MKSDYEGSRGRKLMSQQDTEVADTLASDNGIQSVVFALYDESGNRKGKAWPLHAHDQKLPTQKEVRAIVEELALELRQPYSWDEVFVRSRYHATEGGGLIEGKAVDEVADKWYRGMISTCRAFGSLVEQLEAVRESNESSMQMLPLLSLVDDDEDEA